MEFTDMINEIQTTYRRNKTFTPEEVDTLLDILLKYGHIVESKNISGSAMQQKKKAWEAICNEFNQIHPNRRRSVREVHIKYKNLKNQFLRRSEGRDPSDAVAKVLDDKIRKIRSSAGREDKSSNLTNLFNALLEYPDEVETKTFVLNEPIKCFSQDNTTNDVSMNDSTESSEDIGSFKKVDVSALNDPLKQTLPVEDLEVLKENPQQQSAILDLIRSKHELAAEKVKREIEILNSEHNHRLELAKIEHTRRLEILNKEHELTVQKLKLEIDLLKKN